jgi:hypothetical protein
MRKPKIHSLKTWPEYYAAVLDGRKRFELRQNDRDFQVGDCLVLQEFDPTTGSYTKEMISMVVTYAVQGKPFLPDGLICMSIEPYRAEGEK